MPVHLLTFILQSYILENAFKTLKKLFLQSFLLFLLCIKKKGVI